MVATPFATVAEALAANAKRVALTVLVGGIPTDAWEVHVAHGTDQPVGTCSVVVPAVGDANTALGRTVEVIAGYTGATRRIFHGRIPEDANAYADDGAVRSYQCEGWATLLTYPDVTDMAFPGPISLKDLFRGLCRRRGVPSSFAEETVTPEGAPILLGGNPDVYGGQVIVPRKSSPLDLLTRAAKLFGFRVFDTPSGVLRLARVSGVPPAPPDKDYLQGLDLYRLDRKRASAPWVTYWEVLGARYTRAVDGVVVAVRSIPADVPYNSQLDPPGYAAGQVSDELLVNLPLADACRNALERDFGDAEVTMTWETDGDPERQPGDTVRATAPVVGASVTRYLTRLDQSVTADGYVATMDAWRGNGAPLRAGKDCVSQTLLGAGGLHLSNEYLSHYRRPNPDGIVLTLPITVAADYTSLTAYGYAHGCNSFLGSGTANQSSEASTFEIWQSPSAGKAKEKVGSGTLPVLQENLAQRLPYAQDRYWASIAIPITGGLKANLAAELRILSGWDANVGDRDDFEVRSLTLTTCGVGMPTLPGGVTPYTPAPPRAG